VQLYEVAAVLLVLAYYSWRLLVDFLKPGIRFEGLTILQWTCAAAIIWYTLDLRRIFSHYKQEVFSAQKGDAPAVL
jgi:hypothetical protein